MLLVGFAVFVSAYMTGQGNGPYNVELELNEGWNIIAGTLPKDGISSNSEIQASDIRAMWYYSPTQKKYILVYPKADLESLQKEDEDIYLTSAMWIYSNKAGIIKYSTLEDYAPLENRQLYSGYNFVTITPDMDGKSLNDFKGNCEINKAYLWDVQNQQWGTILNLLDDKNILQKEAGAGYGFIVKVLNDCSLSSAVNGGTITPPSIPN